MELWIRSQDKECLMKVNRVDYSLSNSEHKIYVNGYETLVGHYATEERALEVLDKIQSLLKSKVLLNSGKILGSFEDTIYREPDKVEIQELNTIVYEMPKE